MTKPKPISKEDIFCFIHLHNRMQSDETARCNEHWVITETRIRQVLQGLLDEKKQYDANLIEVGLPPEPYASQITELIEKYFGQVLEK